ncbi:lanthionine synthetase C family protein [Streptomyces sp. NPDC058613]|uniref:lanthionine synthetase C family protein n=1 Tax=Streptomyces sp. NPDC058613 TaxID=3346556 RepID=UPI003646A8B6
MTPPGEPPPSRLGTMIPQKLAAQADALASLVRERLHAPDEADRYAALAGRQTDLSLWSGPSLSEGHAGIALLHLHAARTTGDGEDQDRHRDRAFRFLRRAFQDTGENPLTHPGLFDGTAGLALVLSDCRQDEPRFAASLDSLHDRLARQVLATSWPWREGMVSDHDYDVVYGAAGILSYLCATPHKNALLLQAIDHCLDYLIWLGQPQDGRRRPPRWTIAPDFYSPYGDRAVRYPHGCLDTGMSHGAAGIAAALATAWREGFRRPGQRTALSHVTSWLLETGAAGDRDRERRWRRAVPLSPEGHELTEAGEEAPPAWCHGTAGIAAALLGVADATGDRHLGADAFAAFEGVLARAAGRGAVVASPTVCHGLAGIVALCHEFASRGSTEAAASLPVLVEELLGRADPAHPLVFRDRETSGHVVDNPGLLTGSAGIAMTLQAVTTSHRPTWWKALFLQ